jgi:outer membrane receptor protein involved in Fe transport
LKAPLVSQLGPAFLVTFPLVYGNGSKASSSGFEGALTWNATSWWKLSGTYSHLKIHAHSYADSANSAGALGGFTGLLNGLIGPAQEQALVQGLTSGLTPGLTQTQFSPGNQFTAHSYLNLAKNWTFDTALYFTGSLNANPIVIPAYARLDSRIAWRLNRGVEASLVGQNLQSGRHFEITTIDQLIATQVPRSVFGKITWSF